MGRCVAQMCISLCVTRECGGWGGCGHSDGNAHAAAAAVLSTAAPTAAAGMAASTATTVHTHTEWGKSGSCIGMCSTLDSVRNG